jgi:hypothetical protein
MTTKEGLMIIAEGKEEEGRGRKRQGTKVIKLFFFFATFYHF